MADQHAPHVDRNIAIIRGGIGCPVLNPDQTFGAVRLFGLEGKTDQRFEDRFKPLREVDFDFSPPNVGNLGLEPPRYEDVVDRRLVRPEIHGHSQQRAEPVEQALGHRCVGELAKLRAQGEFDPSAHLARWARLQSVPFAVFAAEVPAFIGTLVRGRVEIDPVTHDVRG